MRVAIEYERAQGRQVFDVHEKNLGYDLTSVDLSSGELRLIEVKGLAEATGTILLTPNERRVAEDRRDCYWLYIVTQCAGEPTLRDPVRDPARLEWHEGDVLGMINPPIPTPLSIWREAVDEGEGFLSVRFPTPKVATAE